MERKFKSAKVISNVFPVAKRFPWHPTVGQIICLGPQQAVLFTYHPNGQLWTSLQAKKWPFLQKLLLCWIICLRVFFGKWTNNCCKPFCSNLTFHGSTELNVFLLQFYEICCYPRGLWQRFQQFSKVWIQTVKFIYYEKDSAISFFGF